MLLDAPDEIPSMCSSGYPVKELENQHGRGQKIKCMSLSHASLGYCVVMDIHTHIYTWYTVQMPSVTSSF